MEPLVGTILIGPNEPGTGRALESLQKMGCSLVYALVDCLNLEQWNIVNSYVSEAKLKLIYRKWDWNWGAARQMLQDAIIADDNGARRFRFQTFLDTDDEVTDAVAEAIKKMVESEETAEAAYQLPYVYVNLSNPQGPPAHILGRTRIFPATDDIQWRLRAHEYIQMPPYIPIIPISVFPIRHWHRPNSPERTSHYVEGLRMDLAENPEDPRICHYLAQSLMEMGYHKEAILYYRQSIKRGSWSEEAMKACLNIAFIQNQMGNHSQAIESAQEALGHMRMRREPYHVMAQAYIEIGNLRAAYKSYKTALKIPCPPHPSLGFMPVLYTEYMELIMAKLCKDLGFYEDGMEHLDSVLSAVPEHPGALDLKGQFEKEMEKATSQPSIKKDDRPIIYFYGGKSLESWTGVTLNESGIGGRETAQIKLAEELAGLGWQAIVFSDCADTELEHRSVQYLHYERFDQFVLRYPPDVTISSLHVDIFKKNVPGLKVMWAHDMGLQNSMTPDLVNRIDMFQFASQFQRDALCKRYNIPLEKAYLQPLGVDLDRFQNHEVSRSSMRMYYASSPDRGLEILLGMWPEIIEKIPGAELHVFYGFDNMRTIAKSLGGQRTADRNAYIDSLLKTMDDLNGVTYYGRIDQDALAVEFLKSSIWVYPTHFMETFCVTAAESLAAGVIPITSDCGAIPETLHGAGIVLSGDPNSQAYRENFIDAVHRLCNDEDFYQEHCANVHDAYVVTWKEVATMADARFRHDIHVERSSREEIHARTT